MQAKPNIVWITLDSIRQDRTSMAGFDRGTTPQMGRIASRESGTAFNECISHGMWSLTSDASVLSGLYPSQHGTGLWNEVLPENIKTVPERFSELGYHTAGISHNGHFNEATGLTRGFDRFEWVNKSNLLETVGPKILLKYILRLRSESAGYTAPLDYHRSDYLSTQYVQSWLDDFTGNQEPFFMFVHMLGAHLPYVPPLPYRDAFTDDIDMPADEAVDIAYDRSINYYREIANGCEFDADEQAAIESQYDALVKYVDRKIGDIFRYVDSMNAGPTVFVVTADHGDLLGEQGVLAHQFVLDDGLVNVPMVVHGLPSLADLPEDSLVQHIDVMRALLKEAGATEADLADMEGIDPREETRQYALSQRGNDTYETAIDEIRQHNPGFDAERYQSGLLHAVRSREHKFVQGTDHEAFYELPDETTDLLESRPELAAQYRTFLERTLDSFEEIHDETEREVSDAMRQQLQDLGYVVE
jgi:uncharacterized sulfatase